MELLWNEKLISGLSDPLLFWPPGLLDFLLREFSLPPPCVTVVHYPSRSSVINSWIFRTMSLQLGLAATSALAAYSFLSKTSLGSQPVAGCSWQEHDTVG